MATIATKQPTASTENARGHEIEVAFSCPDCSTSCAVKWARLSHPISCRGCKGRFWIGRAGKLEAERMIRNVHFNCPRCKEVGNLSITQLSRGTASCGACGLELFTGPDGRLYTAAELEAVKKLHRDAPRNSDADWGAKSLPARLLGVPVVVAMSLCFVITLGLFLRSYLTPATPGETAARFTKVCLAGNWDAAAEYLVPGDDQLVQFRLWRLMSFASILDEHRPEGDKVAIETAVASPDARETSIRVAMSSPFVGQRVLVQQWRREPNGELKLDAIATHREASGHNRGPAAPVVSGRRPVAAPAAPNSDD